MRFGRELLCPIRRGRFLGDGERHLPFVGSQFLRLEIVLPLVFAWHAWSPNVALQHGAAHRSLWSVAPPRKEHALLTSPEKTGPKPNWGWRVGGSCLGAPCLLSHVIMAARLLFWWCPPAQLVTWPQRLCARQLRTGGHAVGMIFRFGRGAVSTCRLAH